MTLKFTCMNICNVDDIVNNRDVNGELYSMKLIQKFSVELSF
jgi:hypothetical protein